VSGEQEDRVGNGGSDTMRRSPAEWLTLSAALLVLTVLIGAVGWLWLSDEQTQPSFQLAVGEARRVEDAYHLPKTVTNSGDATASQVQITGCLGAGDSAESSETTFDQIPGQASVQAVLIFSSHPANAQVRVVSYQAP